MANMMRCAWLLALAGILSAQLSDNVGVSLIRDFLNGDFLRSPVAIVLDSNAKSVRVLRNIWPEGDLPNDNERNVSFFIARSKGVLKLMEATIQNGSQLLSTFEAESEKDIDEKQKDAPLFLGALKAVQYIPFDSGILMVAADAPNDNDLGELLLLGLLHKRSRLFVVWTNEENEGEEFIKNIALQSGGSFYYFDRDVLITKRTSKHHDDETNLTANETAILTELSEKDDSTPFLENDDMSEIWRRKRFAFPNASMEDSKRSGQQQHRSMFTVDLPAMVEVASGTNLEYRPGVQSTIQFEVTNLRNALQVVSFQADARGVSISNVNPLQASLPPNVPIRVQVNFTPLQASGQATITLNVLGLGRPLYRTALISITTSSISDNWAPDLYWKYSGDCGNFKKPANCYNGQWSVEVTAKDETSGIIRLVSHPYGMIFKAELVAGTKSPVTATYTATCCHTKVDIWAEDAKGNYNKRTFDVLNQILYAGEIAAVVLGIILLLLLIAFIVLLIVYCRKRNSDRIVLPRHH